MVLASLVQILLFYFIVVALFIQSCGEPHGMHSLAVGHIASIPVFVVCVSGLAASRFFLFHVVALF